MAEPDIRRRTGVIFGVVLLGQVLLGA